MMNLGQKLSILEQLTIDSLWARMKLYVNRFSTYNGELDDADDIVNAIKSLKGEFPVIYVAYTGGEDEESEDVVFAGEATLKRHHGTMIVVAVSDDNKSQYIRSKVSNQWNTITRLGGDNLALSHKMITDIRSVLEGRIFQVDILDEEQQVIGQETVNHGKLDAIANSYIMRMPGSVAIAVPFNFIIEYTTEQTAPDDGLPIEINEIHFDIDPLGPRGKQATGAPGVYWRVRK